MSEKSESQGMNEVVTPHPAVAKNPNITISSEAGSRPWVMHYWPLLVSTISSFIWIGVCVWVLMQSNRPFDRMPIYEIGGLMAAATIPLVVIWLISLVFLRTDPLRDYRLALAHGLEGLLSPLDVAQRRLNSIVGSLNKEISHVEAAADIASNRMDNLENRFREQITSLFEATTDTENKTAAFRDILSSERTQMEDLSKNITEEIKEMEIRFSQLKFDSESINNTARKNSESLSNEISFQNKSFDERSKKIENRLQSMGEKLTGISGAIATQTGDANEQLSQLEKEITAKQANMTGLMGRMDEVTQSICAQLAAQSTNITDLTAKAENSSTQLAENLKAQAGELTETAKGAILKASETGDVLQEHAQLMRNTMSEADNFFAEKAKNITNISEALEHSVNARVSGAEEAFEKQSDIIRTALIEQAVEIQGMLDKNADGTTSFLEITLKTLEDQSARLNQTVDASRENLEQKTGLIRDHYNAFEDISGKFETRMEGAESLIQGQQQKLISGINEISENISTAVDTIKDHSGELGSQAQQVIGDILEQSEQLRAQMDELRQSSENTTQEIQSLDRQMTEQMESAKWHETAGQIEAQCEHSMRQLENLTVKLQTLEGENEKITDKAEDNIKRISNELRQASESIYLASASAIEASDETGGAIERQNDKLQQLINAYQLSSKSLIKDAEAIESKYARRTGNAFSKVASRIIEQLQSQAIDLSRFIDQDMADDVWDSYLKGDRNVFLRRLKKVTNKKALEGIKNKYTQDSDFRRHVQEYMQCFEEMMANAMGMDGNSALSVTLISSESGKIYLALAQAVGRLS